MDEEKKTDGQKTSHDIYKIIAALGVISTATLGWLLWLSKKAPDVTVSVEERSVVDGASLADGLRSLNDSHIFPQSDERKDSTEGYFQQYAHLIITNEGTQKATGIKIELDSKAYVLFVKPSVTPVFHQFENEIPIADLESGKSQEVKLWIDQKLSSVNVRYKDEKGSDDLGDNVIVKLRIWQEELSYRIFFFSVLGYVFIYILWLTYRIYTFRRQITAQTAILDTSIQKEAELLQRIEELQTQSQANANATIKMLRKRQPRKKKEKHPGTPTFLDPPNEDIPGQTYQPIHDKANPITFVDSTQKPDDKKDPPQAP